MSKASFVSDVGGTNIRLALIEDNEICAIRKYLCADFETINDAIEQFRLDSGLSGFINGCIAIASPINGDQVSMVNHTWSFSKKALARQLQTDDLLVINDFTAVAFSLPELTGQQLVKLGQGSPDPNGNIAVFGPGTGLGVEHLTHTPAGWQTLNGEGGHVDFAPNDDIDLHIWRYIKNQYGRVATEEVLSGRGLVNIYNALSGVNGITPVFDDPAQVTDAAKNKSDATCVLAVQQFCRIMGAFAGNLALNLCTTGGIFIGGGVTSKLGEMFIQSDFRQYFEAKGTMSNYVKPIPTYLINEPEHGLIGAKAFLNQHTEHTQ